MNYKVGSKNKVKHGSPYAKKASNRSTNIYIFEELLTHVNERLALRNDWCNAKKLFLSPIKSEIID